MTIRTDIYLHREKDSNWNKADELGLSKKAAERFAYTCYEVKITLDVDGDTGDSKIIAVDDKAVGEAAR